MQKCLSENPSFAEHTTSFTNLPLASLEDPKYTKWSLFYCLLLFNNPKAFILISYYAAIAFPSISLISKIGAFSKSFRVFSSFYLAALS
jgi:hypothetical protein